MNKTIWAIAWLITYIILFSIVVVYKWIDLEKQIKELQTSNTELSEKVETLENSTITTEDWKDLATYMLDLEDKLYEVVEVYDSNVDIYEERYKSIKSAINDNVNTINDIIDYLN